MSSDYSLNIITMFGGRMLSGCILTVYAIGTSDKRPPEVDNFTRKKYRH